MAEVRGAERWVAPRVLWQNSVLLSGRQLKTARLPLTLPTSSYQTAPASAARLSSSGQHSGPDTFVFSSPEHVRFLRFCLPLLFTGVNKCLHGEGEGPAVPHALVSW